MTNYPKATFIEPVELKMRECGRCAELQERLAAAEAMADEALAKLAVVEEVLRRRVTNK